MQMISSPSINCDCFVISDPKKIGFSRFLFVCYYRMNESTRTIEYHADAHIGIDILTESKDSGNGQDFLRKFLKIAC